MKAVEIATYLDSEAGNDLEPSRTRLLFTYRASHASGFSEEVDYRVGPSKCGKFDVLWGRCDSCGMNAVVWIPRHLKRGKALHVALLSGLFAAQADVFGSDAPCFDEVDTSRGALMTSKDVCEVADAVFGAEADDGT